MTLGSGAGKLALGHLRHIKLYNIMYIMMSTSCRNNRISTKYIVLKVKPAQFPTFFET